MQLVHLTLAAYGRCKDVGIEFGDRLTVVVGPNEAGKSTALDALGDFFWGIPTSSPRTSDFTRPQLRINAQLQADSHIRTFTRKSTGLFEDDLITPITPPWDPNDSLGQDWWQTRLGLNHDALRDAGRKAFAGNGDLAEIIFAAREGRSAKAILEEINTRIDKLYKSHGGAKSVLLRVAEKDYRNAASQLKERLTSADNVVRQRILVKSLEARHRKATEERNHAARGLQTALEDQRVVGAVLRLNQAQSELATITAEGDRLSPGELAEYLQAQESLKGLSKQIDRIDAAIKAKERGIDSLSVDDQLLDNKSTIERFQAETQARIDDLKRADQEFGPAAAAETAQLRDLLRSIGIEAADDLEDALSKASVRADHAATLDDFADQIEILEEKQRQAKGKSESSLGDLSSKGITIELATAQIPREEAISHVRDSLAAANDQASTAQALLDAARDETNALRSSATTPVSLPELTHADVVAARQVRDGQWHNIRRSWLNGELPSSEDRHDMATELDKAILKADGTGDDEAAERSRVATQDALISAHVDGLEAAKRKEQIAHENLKAAAEECSRLETEWNAIWGEMGVRPAPNTANSSAIAGLIIAAHTSEQEARSTAQALAALGQSWSRAAESVGLRSADTTAAWRKQAEILGQINSVQTTRTELLKREADARRKWESFATEAIALLFRHGIAEEGQPLSPIHIEQGLETLLRQAGETAEAAAKRAAYREQIEEQSELREETHRALDEASATLSKLAGDHALGSTEELSVLVERARRASDPLAREEQALTEIRIDLDGGSDPAGAIERLRGRDQVSVDQDAEEAEARAKEAQEEADRALSALTTAKDALLELEQATSAAEAEAEVASRQAEVARLTEEWAVLILQKKLLTKALETLGSSDTRPLLDHAGRLLDELTDGRWVALHAEDDGLTRKLFVIRGDGEKFGTADLSEGTADQVFFSLRLAAVAELHNDRRAAGEPALPLVLDDILMAFDDQRTDTALEVLANLAPGLQVVVLTHHEFVADAAERFGWAKVSRLPAPSPIETSLDGEELRAKLQGSAFPGAAGQAGR